MENIDKISLDREATMVKRTISGKKTTFRLAKTALVHNTESNRRTGHKVVRRRFSQAHLSPPLILAPPPLPAYISVCCDFVPFSTSFSFKSVKAQIGLCLSEAAGEIVSNL